MRILLAALSLERITTARMRPWHGIALVLLLLLLLLLLLVPAAGMHAHGGHAHAAALDVPPAHSPAQAPHRDATPPCCAGPSCADMVPLPATAGAALRRAGLDVDYAPAAACAARGVDAGPTPPPPRPIG